MKSANSQYTLKDLPYDITKINKKDHTGKQGLWVTYDQYKRIHSLKHFINDTLHGYFEMY